jgi:hypothetical protein
MRNFMLAPHKTGFFRWTLFGALLALTNLAQAGQQEDDAQAAEREIHPGERFTFCTVEYTSEGDSGPNAGWNAHFPFAGHDFMLALEKLTTIDIVRDERDVPKQVIVKLTDDTLSDYHHLFLSHPGSTSFTEEEIKNLRDYLLAGGFLHVDDFWGSAQWKHWEKEIGRALPPAQYPITDIPPDHPLFNIVFRMDHMPQVPGADYWDKNRTTSEMGEDSKAAHLRGIHDKNGRLLVVMSHNTALADAWRRPGDDPEYFMEFSPRKAIPIGINIAAYAMTH